MFPFQISKFYFLRGFDHANIFIVVLFIFNLFLCLLTLFSSFQDDNKLDVNTIYSEDFIQSVEKDREMKELVTNIMKEVGRPNLVDCFPVLKIINPHGIKRRTWNYFEKFLNILT